MDNLYQSDISLNFIISPSENAILFALAKVQIEHVPCPKLDWTLQRSGQCAGVEDSAILPVRFSHTMNQVKVSTGKRKQYERR